MYIKFVSPIVSPRYWGGLLKRYYMEYFFENPELFFVSENNSKISGFCMGYLVDGINFTRRFLRHNYIRIFVVLLNNLVTKRCKAL